MKGLIDRFLQANGAMSRYELSMKTGLSEATLSRANNRSVETMTVKTIVLIGNSLEMTPGEVLDDLLKIEGGA